MVSITREVWRELFMGAFSMPDKRQNKASNRQKMSLWRGAMASMRDRNVEIAFMARASSWRDDGNERPA